MKTLYEDFYKVIEAIEVPLMFLPKRNMSKGKKISRL